MRPEGGLKSQVGFFRPMRIGGEVNGLTVFGIEPSGTIRESVLIQ